MGLKVTKATAPLVKPTIGWAGRQLILKPIWRAQGKFTNPLSAMATYDGYITWTERAQLAIAIAQIVDGSSSQDLVQNGGPSAPPLLQSGRPSDVLSLGKTLKTQSAHGFRSGKARTAGGKRRSRRPRCPYVKTARKWVEGPSRPSVFDIDRCVKRAGHHGQHRKR